MRILNAHQFTNREENLIQRALLALAFTIMPESGDICELPRKERTEYEEVMNLYRNF